MRKVYLPKQSRYTRKLKLIKSDEYGDPQIELHGWYFSMECDDEGRELIGIDNHEDEFIDNTLKKLNELEDEYERNGWGTPWIECYAYPTVDGQLAEITDPERPWRTIHPREGYAINY